MFISVTTSTARKGQNQHLHTPLQQYQVGAPMEHVGPFPSTDKGNRYILVAVDHFTKWPGAYTVLDQSASTLSVRCSVALVYQGNCTVIRDGTLKLQCSVRSARGSVLRRPGLHHCTLRGIDWLNILTVTCHSETGTGACLWFCGCSRQQFRNPQNAPLQFSFWDMSTALMWTWCSVPLLSQSWRVHLAWTNVTVSGTGFSWCMS